MKRIAMVLMVLMAATASGQTKKLFVYYPTWAPNTMPPQHLKFPSGMETIYMHFSAHVAHAKSIVNLSGTTPVIIEVTNHGWQTGDRVYITGNAENPLLNNTAANPNWTITRLSANTFSVPATFVSNNGSRGTVSHASFFAPTANPVSASSDSAQLHFAQQAFIDTCHNAGQKVMLSLTAQGPEPGSDGQRLYDIAVNSVMRKQFVSASSNYMKRKGYDGIDIDWESWLDSAAVSLLIKEYRDTLNSWPVPGLLTMATHSDPFIYPGLWGFYNTATMNAYLDAYFGMNYVMNTNERSWGSLGAANAVWRCMFDCPYVRPTAAPWNGFEGGYWSQDFKTNSLAPWKANGADTTKYGIGLWNGGTTMLNSGSGSVPGSVISYGTPGYISYETVISTGTNNYEAAIDHWWGIKNGLYCSWIDSAGTFRRTKWANDTMHTNIFMLYDAHSGFIPTGQRYGRQPHFDAMVNAIKSISTPTVIASVSSHTFNSITPGPSNTRTHTVSGSGLTANISLTLSGGDAAQFVFSTNGGSTWVQSATLVQSGGSVPLTTISVRCTASTAGLFVATLNHASTGAVTQPITLSCTSVAPSLSLIPPSLGTFSRVLPAASNVQAYLITTVGVSSQISLSLGGANPTHFEMSLNQVNWVSSLQVNPPQQGIYVRFIRPTVGTSAATLTHTVSGLSPVVLTLNGLATNDCSGFDVVLQGRGGEVFGDFRVSCDTTLIVGVAASDSLRLVQQGRDAVLANKSKVKLYDSTGTDFWGEFEMVKKIAGPPAMPVAMPTSLRPVTTPQPGFPGMKRPTNKRKN